MAMFNVVKGKGGKFESKKKMTTPEQTPEPAKPEPATPPETPAETPQTPPAKPEPPKPAETPATPETPPETPATPETPPPAETVPLSEDFGGNPPGMEPPPEPPKRGRGRPPGSTNTPKPPGITPSIPAEFLGTAGMAFDLGTGTFAMIFGDEWKPRNEQERNFVVNAIAAYIQTTGIREIPPKYLMLIALAAYSAPRFAAPTTQDKLRAFWLWAKIKLSGIFSFFKRKP